MADSPLDDRKFTDDEVRRILKKAVESRSTSRSLVAREGLTLAEIKSIGEEVGIDPVRLDEAARSVMVRDATGVERVLGGPTELRYERRGAGSFDPDDTTEIVASIRRAMGHQGEVSELRGALEWSHVGESRDRHISVSSRDGQVTVRGASNMTKSAVLTYLPAGSMGLIASFAGLATFAKSGTELGLALGLATLPALYPVLRTVLSRVTKSEERRLQQAVDEIATLLDPSEE